MFTLCMCATCINWCKEGGAGTAYIILPVIPFINKIGFECLKTLQTTNIL